MLLATLCLLSTVIRASLVGTDAAIEYAPNYVFAMAEPVCENGWKSSFFHIPTVVQKLGPLITCSQRLLLPMRYLEKSVIINFEGLEWRLERAHDLFCGAREKADAGLKITCVSSEGRNDHKVTGILEMSFENLSQQIDQSSMQSGQDPAPGWTPTTQHAFIGSAYPSLMSLGPLRQFEETCKSTHAHLKLRFFYGQHTGNTEYNRLRYLDESTKSRAKAIANRFESQNIKKLVQLAERTRLLSQHFRGVTIQKLKFELHSPRYTYTPMTDGTLAFYAARRDLIAFRSFIGDICAPQQILWNKDPTDLLLNHVPMLNDYYLDDDIIPFRILLKLMCIAALRIAKIRAADGKGTLLRCFLNSLRVFYPNVRVCSLRLLKPQPGSSTTQPFYPLQIGNAVMTDRANNLLVVAEWDGVILQIINNGAAPRALCLVFTEENSQPDPRQVILELLILRNAIPVDKTYLSANMLVELVDNYQIHIIN